MQRCAGATAAAGLVIGAAFLHCASDGPSSAPAPEAGADAATDDGVRVDAGTDAETAPVPIATSAGKDEDPSVVRAADGTFHLVWFSDRSGKDGLWIKSSKDGVEWTVDRAIASDDEHDFYPSMTQDASGRFHLVWWRGVAGDGGKILGSIWYASSPDTVTWTPPVLLSGTSALAWTPSIAERVPGELCVAWSSDEGGDKDLYVLSSTNGGASWSPAPVRVGEPGFNDDIPSIAARPDGSLVLAWHRYDATATAFEDAFTHPSSEVVYATSADGKTWSSATLVTMDPPSARVPDVIAALFPSSDPTGLSIAWTSTRAPGAEKGDVFAVGLGAVAGVPRRLTSAPGRDYSARFAPTATPGRYLMVWVSDANAGNLDIWGRFVVP